MEGHEPYSLEIMAQILCELSTELQEGSMKILKKVLGKKPRLRLMRLRGQRQEIIA